MRAAYISFLSHKFVQDHGSETKVNTETSSGPKFLVRLQLN
ncbi:hypothetical protein BH11BAC1_BH11BAC1_26490 [soil metagenome]